MTSNNSLLSSTQQQQYCLRWNNHQTNLQRVFARLLRNETFTDVTLACDGLSLQAHKIVLSACSSYFEQLFTAHSDKSPLVILKDVKFGDIKLIVDFMYLGEINVAQEQLPSLIKTAETLKVKGLAEVSSDASSNFCETENVRKAHDLHESRVCTANNLASSTSIVTSSTSTSENQFITCDKSHNNKSLSNPTNSSSTTQLSRHIAHTASTHTTNTVSASSHTTPLKAPPLQAGVTAVSSLSPTPRAIQTARESLAAEECSQAPTSLVWNRTLDTDIADTPCARDTADTPSVSNSSAVPSTCKSPSLAAAVAAVAANIVYNKELEEAELLESFNDVAKLEDYVMATASRDGFWYAEGTRRVLSAVKQRRIGLRTGADILGVSYNTIYNRYRELYGPLTDSQYNISAHNIPRTTLSVQQNTSQHPVSSSSLQTTLVTPAQLCAPTAPVSASLGGLPPSSDSTIISLVNNSSHSTSSTQNSTTSPMLPSMFSSVQNAALSSSRIHAEDVSPSLLATCVPTTSSVSKLSEYVASGGMRHMFWELETTRSILEAIRGKRIEMKQGAEMLGVSYGTLYGRYRENYGYLKSPGGWKRKWSGTSAGVNNSSMTSNVTGIPSTSLSNLLSDDPFCTDILQRVTCGDITVQQAAEQLGVDYYMLKYNLGLIDSQVGESPPHTKKSRTPFLPGHSGLQEMMETDESEIDMAGMYGEMSRVTTAADQSEVPRVTGQRSVVSCSVSRSHEVSIKREPFDSPTSDVTTVI